MWLGPLRGGNSYDRYILDSGVQIGYPDYLRWIPGLSGLSGTAWNPRDHSVSHAVVATCRTYYFLRVGNMPPSHAHATFRLATLLHAYVICLGFSHIRMHVGERGPLEFSLWILSCLGAPLTVVDSYILIFGSSLA